MLDNFTKTEIIEFQSLLMKFQMYADNYFTHIAAMTGSPCIVLCDRAVADCKAYMSEEDFQALLAQENWNWMTLRNQRYDQIVFLQSAADGAE